MQRCVRITAGIVLILMASVSSAGARDYYLDTDDVVTITVYREDELGRRVRISAEGYISMPLIGKIKATGMTVTELEQAITDKLAAYLKKPQVTIFIEKYGTFTVTGQVKKAGSYAADGDISVIEAISRAGGFTSLADRDNVVVMRIEEGKQISIIVPVDEISKAGTREKDILLGRGDIVFVPEQEESTITIAGQVHKPGSYVLTDDLTVLKAISLAGGFTKFAQRNGVKVMRTVGDEQEILRVRVAEISKTGDRSKDVSLQSGDIVFVPESLF